MFSHSFSKLWRWRLLCVSALFLLGVVLLAGCGGRAQNPVGASITGEDATVAGGFRRAEPGTAIDLPADHGPHPDFQTEWWYFTGNLADEGGERWGYQFTIFRRALEPEAVERASDWAGNQVYLAHFAVTDVAAGEHTAWERFSRAGADLAGAEAEPLRVWLEDWQVRETAPDTFRLSADAENYGLDLTLRALKAPVLQGQNGYSQKGPEPSNASFYYSYTRLESEGTVRRGDELVPISGLSWMDHEWSTSALGEGQIGWDWFSIQLDGGWELMAFQLRGADGTVDPFSSGSLIDPAGEATYLKADDFVIEPTDTWRSRATGAEYPGGWRLTVPDHSLSLDLEPLLPDQEMVVSTRYWEGAVAVRGERNGEPVQGYGYVELTGYSGSMEGRF